MSLIRRIENGTTTVKDARTVKSLMSRALAFLLIGAGIGILLVVAAIAIFGV